MFVLNLSQLQFLNLYSQNTSQKVKKKRDNKNLTQT